jgi:hypothetical protein
MKTRDFCFKSRRAALGRRVARSALGNGVSRVRVREMDREQARGYTRSLTSGWWLRARRASVARVSLFRFFPEISGFAQRFL